MKGFIERVVHGRDLSAAEAEQAMDLVMNGEASPPQIAAFLTALRLKGETPGEILGCARSMRAHATRVRTRRQGLVDTCGTGGDASGTFNISTTAAFVVAAAGVPVAKHGNRSVSSKCGSADVLEALGVAVDLGPEALGVLLDEAGIAFLFAPRLHASMRHAAPVRRDIGIRTIFNLLGPLTNPAGAEHQVVGVYDPTLTEVLAGVLLELGARHAFVVHGFGGVDELSLAGPTRVSEAGEEGIRTFEVVPRDLGLPEAPVAAIAGGGPEVNAGICRRVLAEGERGPRRDVLLLNAAAALVAADVARSFTEGLGLAAEAIDSGRAARLLDELPARSQQLAAAERAGEMAG